MLIYSNVSYTAESGQAEEIQILKQQIQTLLKRVEQLEEKQKNAPQELAAQAQSHEVKPEKNDGLQWEVGGYAKLDGIFSSNSAGANSIGDEFLVNSLIPANDSTDENNQLKLTARESRIWVRTYLPISEGSFKTYVEGDFFGNKPDSSEILNNDADFRLRQAYGIFSMKPYGHFLFGQAWTTFQNLTAFPHTTTLGTLPGQIFSRVPQVRWTWPFDNGSMQFSVENPESQLRDSNNTTIRPDDDRIPDIVARINWQESWGNVSLASLIRELRCEISGICNDEKTGWGISAAGRFQLSDKDDVRFQANWGDGIGRFISGTAYPGGVVDSQGNIDNVEVRSLMLSYQHWWNSRWSSALIYNISDANDISSVPGAIEQLQTFHINLMWWPVKRFRLGLEYLHAESEFVNQGERELDRLIFSSKFIF